MILAPVKYLIGELNEVVAHELRHLGQVDKVFLILRMMMTVEKDMNIIPNHMKLTLRYLDLEECQK